VLVDFVEDTDMVVAVEIGRRAVAVRQLPHPASSRTRSGVRSSARIERCATAPGLGADARRTDAGLPPVRINSRTSSRDEQTGSWWQQVTGEAIQGPLRGRRLEGVVHDEVSFGIWKAERPGARVLKPVAARRDDYAPADWERQMKKVETVTPRVPGDPLEPRAVVVGVTLNGRSKAYPFSLLRKQSPVLDVVGGVPIVLVVGEDGKSIRVFDRRIGDLRLEILARTDTRPGQLLDAETGSEWSFAGRAVAGPWPDVG
jgi:hypothetical protein